MASALTLILNCDAKRSETCRWQTMLRVSVSGKQLVRRLRQKLASRKPR
jgi:hypothetical protein